MEVEETLFRQRVCKLGKCSLQWKLKVNFTERMGKSPFIEKVFTQVPDWFNFMQMKEDSDWSDLHGPNWLTSCILIHCYGAVLISQCRCK